jgi:hypothetical protein
MYILLSVFCSDVNFPAVPEFYQKNRIARAGKIFLGQKISGFFFFERKNPGSEYAMGVLSRLWDLVGA